MKNKKALYLLLAANAISRFAQGISMLAIPWYFADILGESSTFGVIYAATTFLTLFWGLYAGTIIDRYPRKNIFLSLCASGFVIVLGVSLTGYYFGEIPPYLIAVVFAATIFNYNIHYPTLYAFGQEISEKENYGKITSIIEVQGQSISVFSGAFAAILLTGINYDFLASLGLENIFSFTLKPWKLHDIFLLDACTYLLSFVLILFIKYHPIENNTIDTGSVWKRLNQGIVFLKKNPLLFHFGYASFSIFVIILIHVHQLMPIYVNNHLEANSSVYAGAEMMYAFGALFSGIGIRWLFKKTNSIKAIIILMIITTLVLELTAFSKSPLILLFICLILGLTNAGTRVLRIIYLMDHIPNNIIGRTGSVFQSINILFRFTFISIFSLTFFSKGSNIIWSYFIGGIFILVSIIPFIIYYQPMVKLPTKKEEKQTDS